MKLAAIAAAKITELLIKHLQREKEMKQPKLDMAKVVCQPIVVQIIYLDSSPDVYLKAYHRGYEELSMGRVVQKTVFAMNPFAQLDKLKKDAADMFEGNLL